MNKTQLKCLCVFAIFAIIGFGPVSPGCLVGMYIVIMRPSWFLKVVDDLYNNPVVLDFIVVNDSKNTRIRSFLCLLLLFIIDIAPVPVTPVIAFVIILSRPQWFFRVIRGVYSDKF